MPAYEFELVGADGRVLQTFPLLLPVAERNAVTLRRVTVPKRVNISGAAVNEQAPEIQTMRGYHRQEEKLGSRFKSQYSADQVKRALQTKPLASQFAD